MDKKPYTLNQIKKCSNCKGSGIKVDRRNNHLYDSGSVRHYKCPSCHGSGMIGS